MISGPIVGLIIDKKDDAIKQLQEKSGAKMLFRKGHLRNKKSL